MRHFQVWFVAALLLPAFLRADAPAPLSPPAATSSVRIVYIIDRSATTGEQLAGLQDEVGRSIVGLLPIQSFAVIAVGEEPKLLGPERLQRATPENKRAVRKALEDLRPEGQIDQKLAPFQKAFEAAFALKPQVIYFATRARFDPELIKAVSDRNAEPKARILAVSFLNADPDHVARLTQLARESGGSFKLIREQDLERVRATQPASQPAGTQPATRPQ